MHGSRSGRWSRSIPQKREIRFSRDSLKKPELWFRELTDGLGNAARYCADRKLCKWPGQNAVYCRIQSTPPHGKGNWGKCLVWGRFLLLSLSQVLGFGDVLYISSFGETPLNSIPFYTPNPSNTDSCEVIDWRITHQSYNSDFWLASLTELYGRSPRRTVITTLHSLVLNPFREHTILDKNEDRAES